MRVVALLKVGTGWRLRCTAPPTTFCQVRRSNISLAADPKRVFTLLVCCCLLVTHNANVHFVMPNLCVRRTGLLVMFLSFSVAINTVFTCMLAWLGNNSNYCGRDTYIGAESVADAPTTPSSTIKIPPLVLVDDSPSLYEL